MFTVLAGNYDGYERNCKYSDNFDSLDEAIEALDAVAKYPWSYIEYKGRILDVFYKGYNLF